METAPKEAVHADLGDEIKTAFEKFGDRDSKVPKEELAGRCGVLAGTITQGE